MPTPELKLQPESLTRIYADISTKVERQMRERILAIEKEQDIKLTRKQYLEGLIVADVMANSK